MYCLLMVIRVNFLALIADFHNTQTIFFNTKKMLLTLSDNSDFSILEYVNRQFLSLMKLKLFLSYHFLMMESKQVSEMLKLIHFFDNVKENPHSQN